MKKMKRLIKGLPVLLLIAMLVSIGMGSTAYAQTETKVYWAKGDSTVPLTAIGLDSTNDYTDIVRLKADVPAGKTLQAFNITVTYDPTIADVVDIVKNPPTLFANETPGIIVFNGFTTETENMVGPTTVPLLDVTIRGLKSNSSTVFNITVNNFGAGASDQFPPTTANIFPLTVSIGDIVSLGNEAYWSDASGVRFDSDQTTLAVGETKVIRLTAEVPANKTLRAFKFTLTYDPTKIEVLGTPQSASSVFDDNEITVNETIAGVISVNGFDTTGETGAKTVYLLDVTIKGLVDIDTPTLFTITANNFGDDDTPTDEFRPDTTPLTIVKAVIPVENKAYFADDTGTKITDLNLSVGEEKTITLKAEVPAGETLKAYHFDINSFDLTKIGIVSYDETVSPFYGNAFANEANGTIVTNGFSTTGVGEGTYSILAITVKGIAEGDSPCNIESVKFGDETKEFVPTAENLTIHIGPSTCDAVATFSVVSTDGLTANFDATGSVGTLSWDFGGDGSANLTDPMKPSFTYAADGTYTVTLTATGTGGCINTATKEVTVSAPAENKTYFTDNGSKITDLSLDIGEEKTIILVAEVPAGEKLRAYNFELTYDNSVVQVVSYDDTVSPFSSDGYVFTNPENAADMAGTIITNGFIAPDPNDPEKGAEGTVSIIAITVKGLAQGVSPFDINVKSFGSDGDNQFPPTPENLTITVGGCDAIAQFTASPTSGVAPLTVTFDTTDSTGTLEFNYGDGQTGTATTHTYSSNGDYTITLTATGTNGCTTIATQSITVTTLPCDAYAIFTASTDGLTATFNTSGSNGSLSFNYGDGKSGSALTHTYASSGTYTVTLTAMTTTCSRTYTVKVTVGQLHTITVNPCDNGTAYMDGVLVDGDVLVDEGATPTFTFEADDEYVIDNVKVDGASFGSVNKIVFTNPVTADHTIDVSCAKEGVQYKITATAEGNGTISPVGEILVNEGGTKTFTFTPDDGYRIADVLVDDVSVGKRASYTFTNVIADRTIHVIFEEGISHIITATAETGGTIEPAGEVVVNDGDNKTFTFTPDENYKVGDVLVDDVSVIDEVVDNSYTFTNVTDKHTIHVTFEPLVTTYKITTTAGENGEIVPAGEFELSSGESKEFKIDSDEGYEIDDVLVDGITVGSVAKYTVDVIDKDRTIEATFATSLITAIAGDNGRITVAANPDGSRSAVVFPDDGYKVNTVLVDGEPADLTDDSYLFNDGLPHTIEVTFIEEVCDAKAVFTATVEGLTATFDTTGSTETLEFDYGDGTTGTETTHTYAAVGTYTVELTATGSDGCTVTATKTVVFACDAIATFTSIVDGFTATFSTSGSVGTLEFDYGDGTTDTATTHTYAAAGIYAVKLTATGTAGCTVTTTKTVAIVCDAAAIFTSIVDGFTATFNTSGSVGTSLEFDYGDGTIGTETTHTYAAVGTYTVELTATGTNACTVTTTKTVAIVCDAVATFTYSTEELTATFNTSGSVGTLAFNYGDSTTGTEITHTYAEDGVYIVTLTATGTDACTVTATKNVTVSKTIKPKYTISAPVSIVGGTINPSGEFEVNEGDSVTFTVTPYEGYELDSVLVNGQSQAVGSDGRFTVSNITSDTTIDVTFKEKPVPTYTITAEAGDYGTIYPIGEIDVAEGGIVKFVFISESDYEVADVLLNGVSIGKHNSYTFTNVNEDASIYVTFKITGNYITDENGVKIPASKAVSDADKATWGLTGISAIYTLDNVGAVGIEPNTGVTVKTLDYMSAMGIDNPDSKLMDMGLVGSTSEIATADGFVEFTLELSGDVYKPSQDDMPRWYQYDRDSNTIIRYPSTTGEAGSDQGFATFNYGSNGRLESVTLRILDGGEFDLDGLANGSVEDMSGYGIDMVNNNLTFETESLGDWKIEFEANTTSVGRCECVTWNFGDDSEYTSCAQTSMNGAIKNPVTHVYAKDGTYTVTLIADGANGIQTVSRTFTITNGRISVAGGDGGGDNCFISSASNGSMSFGSMVALMLMTLAGAIAVVFSRRVQ